MVAAPPDPAFDISKFDLGKDLPRLAWAHSVLDATVTDLSNFRRRGGKLLMIHGWAD